MPDMRLIVVGAGGRMGRMLVKTIAETEGVALAGAVEQAGGLIGQDSGVLAGLAANQLPLVSDAKPLIADADGILDFTAPAATLDDDFDIEILEMHHNRKVDAPSGTALLLGAAAAEGRGIDLAERKIAARDGITGARRKGDVGFASLRGGSVVGDHSVIFAAPGERIELVHRAEDRGIYARSAIKAALWARGKPPGLYSMADVLGLESF